MIRTAKYWIEKLELQKHPEGGWFKEVYRSEGFFSETNLPERYTGDRNFCTSIYYLLEGNDFSHFHKIKSDEIWHFYTGTTSVEVLLIQNNKLVKQRLGNNPIEKDKFQVVIPKESWFAARLLDTDGYALIGCTVSPGFHFDDFEMADEKLLSEYPHIANEIRGMLKYE